MSKPVKTTERSGSSFGVAQVKLEIAVRAPRARVWEALVRDTAAWWPRDFSTVPPGRALRGFTLEPRLGGRLFEDWGDGAGLIWYTVIGIDPGSMLMLQGHLSAAYGGPATLLLHLTLRDGADGAGTALCVADTVFGRVGDELGGVTREGWLAVFDGGLRAYIEGRGRG